MLNSQNDNLNSSVDPMVPQKPISERYHAAVEGSAVEENAVEYGAVEKSPVEGSAAEDCHKLSSDDDLATVSTSDQNNCCGELCTMAQCQLLNVVYSAFSADFSSATINPSAFNRTSRIKPIHSIFRPPILFSIS